jgi:glucose-1-phosphate thymidylyltransferase
MHDYLESCQRAASSRRVGGDHAEQQEMYVGDVIQAAIDDALQVESVTFHDGSFLDIGSPDDLVRAYHTVNPTAGQAIVTRDRERT